VPHVWPDFSLPHSRWLILWIDLPFKGIFEVVTMHYGGTLAPLDPILPILGWDVLSLGRILYMWHNYLDSLCIFDLVLIVSWRISLLIRRMKADMCMHG
jgi:hypothetical protein